MSFARIWWIAFAVKVILLPVMPLTPDETYYFAWGRHPALSYFDHPPVISWIMNLAIPFWKTPFGIRLPGVIIGHLSSLPWIWILDRLGFSKKNQALWLLVLLLGPLTGLGGFIVTPDVPLMFFWAWGAWLLLETTEKPTLKNWVFLGCVAGLGLLSKYVMVLFFPAALIWLYLSGNLRLLKKPGPWLALVVATLVFSPVIIWNLQNGFASFAFQTKHGLAAPHFNWHWPVDYLSGQFGLINPAIALMFIGAILTSGRKNLFLTVFALTPLAFFFLTSFRAPVEANWPVCAYPACAALAVSFLQNHPRWQGVFKAGMALSVFFIVVVVSHVIKPWLPIPADKDHTRMTREWLADVEAAAAFHPLFARSFQMAAYHSHFRPADREVFKPAGLDRKDFYDFLPQSAPTGHAYIILRPDDILPAPYEARRVSQPVARLPSGMNVYELK